MTQSLTQLHPIWQDFPAIQKELQAVLNRIEANMDANDPEVEAALFDMFNAGEVTPPCVHIVDWSFLPCRTRATIESRRYG